MLLLCTAKEIQKILKVLDTLSLIQIDVAVLSSDCNLCTLA